MDQARGRDPRGRQEKEPGKEASLQEAPGGDSTEELEKGVHGWKNVPWWEDIGSCVEEPGARCWGGWKPYGR